MSAGSREVFAVFRDALLEEGVTEVETLTYEAFLECLKTPPAFLKQYRVVFEPDGSPSRTISGQVLIPKEHGEPLPMLMFMRVF